MEKLEHPLWIVQLFNAVFGPAVAAALRPFGFAFKPGQEVIPDFIVMSLLILVGLSVLCVIIRSRLSVENPGKLQMALEEAVSFLNGMLDDYVGPKGRTYLPLVGTMFVFILIGNLMGLVPGLKSPTSNFNVTLGCALTVFVYYQFHGFKEQGAIGYFRHFLSPPGAPIWIAPIYFPVEIISHFSRILSLSVRQAYIFAMLTTIYLAGAVVVDHGSDGHDAHGAQAAAEAHAA
jgi:F-type H+-transporting ATPase subunit a